MTELSETAIMVDKVTKTFKLPHEKHGSLKSLFINMLGRGKKYEKHVVLNDVSLEIKEGEFFAIVGRNGSGKSTLLKLLAGVYSPNKGHVHVRGRLTPFIELGVGFNPELSGRDNVFLNGALLGFSKKEMELMYKDIVEFAELERFMDQKLKNYSSGMQVRLAFSIAIRAQSDILLLDEVLAVGDAAFQQKCYNYFEELKQRKQTVVFVSHDMGAVQRFCTRAAYIKKGEITKIGNPDEVAALYIEDNISAGDSETPIEKTLKKEQNKYYISAKIAKQTNSSVYIKISYKSKTKAGMYIGLSISYDGRSVAEITTDPNAPLYGSGAVEYILDTSLFNGGAYKINGACLFDISNRSLLAFSKNREEFQVSGSDIRRGSALKLADTWVYAKSN